MATTNPRPYGGSRSRSRKARGYGCWGSRRSKRTAQNDNTPLGWAEIVHPFHPLGGQRFEVLKTRRVGGVETLLIRHPEFGSTAVARDWTDWAGPSLDRPDPEPAAPIGFDALLAVATLLAGLDGSGGG